MIFYIPEYSGVIFEKTELPPKGTFFFQQINCLNGKVEFRAIQSWTKMYPISETEYEVLKNLHG